MKNKRNHRGFTIAEMLIVVAIITVLAGVSFVAVQRHQRSMSYLECDNIAKELYFAAQNHLTMAESQGYLGEQVSFGKEDDTDSNDNVYYIVGPSSGNILDLMLPFGSIDETVRSGGSYLIRYQADPAVVLDVFYCATTGKYSRTLSEGDFTNLMGLRDTYGEGGKNNRNARLNFDSAVVGWYGGADTQQVGAELNAPVITVENAERLAVTVNPSNVNLNEKNETIIDAGDLSLKLLITNLDDTETAMAAIPLSVSSKDVSAQNHARVAAAKDENDNDVFVVTLDDITTENMHFADINTDSAIDKQGTFKPGEDITVTAVAYSNTVLASIVYSNSVTVNSLFADVKAPGDDTGLGVDNDDDDDDDTGTSTETGNAAIIAYFRHLENLDPAISGLNAADLDINVAEQTVDLGTIPQTDEADSATVSTETTEESEADLPTGGSSEGDKDYSSWTGFLGAIREAKDAEETASVNVYLFGGGVGTADNCYYPVSPTYSLEYKGNGHSITNVTASETTNPAGLFGAPSATLKVSDLKLYDFTITGTNAGALVGTLSGDSQINNVLAYHGSDSTKDITGTDNAGGLIGSMTTGTVEHCAAALLVSSGSGSAGGLIGYAGNVTVTGSYSGGHTLNGGVYSENIDAMKAADEGLVNVIGGTNAGGLIGYAGSGAITNCYSTCSAAVTGTSAMAGGMVGNAACTIKNCYATGLVVGPKTASLGAFAGSLSYAEDCSYYEAVNPGLAATGTDTFVVIEQIDADLTTYTAFIGDKDNDWTVALPYDPKLVTIYGNKYNLQNVVRLGEILAADKEYFVAIHYGDWPVPGIQVLNTPTGGSAGTVSPVELP